MFRERCRGSAAVLALLALVTGPALPPLHAHEDDHHAHAIVHRHYAPHQPASQDDQPSTVDDDDHVVWLDTSVMHALPFQLDVPYAVLIRVPEPATPSRSWSAITFDEGAPAHGPPRSSASLRAPPILPA